METKRIGERAKASAERTYATFSDKYCYEVGYYNGATDQDGIARQEVYREIYSWLHYEYKYGKKKAGDVVDDIKRYCFEHAKSIQID